MATRLMKILIGTSIAGVVLFALGFILGYAVFPPIVDSKIKDATKLENNTSQWDRFEVLPVTMPIKITFFNVNNPEGVLLKGEAPDLTEKGPYVYDQKKFKYDIKIDGNTVSYYQTQNITFNEDASVGSDDDEITLFNMAYLATLQITEQMTIPLPIEDYNAVFSKIFDGTGIWSKVRVKDVLFNGLPFCKRESLTDDIGAKLICLVVRLMNLKNVRQEKDRLMFSFLDFKQMKDDGLWKVDRGMDDIKQLGDILTWNGEKYSRYWKGSNSNCNKVEGRDSTIYPPHINEGDSFTIYTTDLCRSDKT